MSAGITIRQFADTDASWVRGLFISITRSLCPPELREAFEAYISRSLAEEIDRISDYYREKRGGFWVAMQGDEPIGMFGLEQTADGAMELRRMYVDPGARRRGIARQMLHFAEDECRRRAVSRLVLSTSELQTAALALYRNAGYRLVHEAVAEAASNKTVGAGIRRYCFEKGL